MFARWEDPPLLICETCVFAVIAAIYGVEDRALVLELVEGPALDLAEDVRATSTNGYAEFSVSRQGTLFCGHGAAADTLLLGWRDRSGKELEKIGKPMRSAPSACRQPGCAWPTLPELIY